MSLQSWLQNSRLVRHTTSAEEIANLLRISDRDLAACKAKDLPVDWKLAIAYNAALQAATAALAAEGYRASRIVTTIVSFNRWSSPLEPTEVRLTFSMVFGRSGTSAAMICRERCRRRNQMRCTRLPFSSEVMLRNGF
jgi:hypothetical protein